MNDPDEGPKLAPSCLRLDEKSQLLASLGSCGLGRTLFDARISAMGGHMRQGHVNPRGRLLQTRLAN